MESSLRIEVQKWRSDAEFADRKLRNSEEENTSAKHKIKEMKQDLESTQRLVNQLPKSDNQDRFSKIDQEHQSLIKAKNQVEEDLKTQTNEMQKFQFEYEDQVQSWKKEKSDL